MSLHVHTQDAKTFQLNAALLYWHVIYLLIASFCWLTSFLLIYFNMFIFSVSLILFVFCYCDICIGTWQWQNGQIRLKWLGAITCWQYEQVRVTFDSRCHFFVSHVTQSLISLCYVLLIVSLLLLVKLISELRLIDDVCKVLCCSSFFSDGLLSAWIQFVVL